MKTGDFWEEVYRRFGKENSSMNVTDFYGGDRFALFVDLRSMGENQLHGSGLRLVNTKDGVQLTINRTMSGSGNVQRHIFIFSDAQFNIVNKELEGVTYWFHIKFFRSKNMDWKNFRGWMSEISLERSLKILGRARPYPKFGELFFPSTMWKGNSVGVAPLLGKIRVWLGQKVSPKLLQ